MRFAAADALYLLALLPVLSGLFFWAARKKGRTADALGDRGLVERLSMRTSRVRERLKAVLLLASVLFLVVAMARPQWGRGTDPIVVRGVDVFLVLDTSFSMDAPDVAPSRMERARYIASELMKRLHGNRVGLIVFAGEAFVQCPLTLDYGAARIFLDTVATGIVPEPGTNLVQALEAARRGFVSQESKHRVIVLLTDGEQHVGDVLKVAESAREDDIVIHAVGVGTPGGQPIPVRDERGGVADYIRDDDGQPVLSRLDEETLSRVARTTGGEYFRVSETDREIEELSARIMGMEGEELESQLRTSYQERFYVPLAIAVLLLVVETGISRGRKREVPA